jgi:hypothetical protein
MGAETNAAANEGAKLVGVVHAFDVEGLAGWMRAHVDGFMGTVSDLSVEQFQGGQSNPTYRIRSGDKAWILRRKPSPPLSIPTSKRRWSTTPLPQSPRGEVLDLPYKSKTGCILRFERLAAFESNNRRSIP